jgi:hypothetical protein
MPCGWQTERDHGSKAACVLFEDAHVQNGGQANLIAARGMYRRSIAAAQLLHGFVLDADSFLPNL